MKNIIIILLVLIIISFTAINGFALEQISNQGIHLTIMDVSGDWKLDGDYSRQALIISIEGVVNKHGPLVYLLYGANYYYSNVKPLLDFYHEKHKISYSKINTIEEALYLFKKYIKGYIVWDAKVIDTINLAFTAAGLFDAIVVSEKEIAIAKKAGLELIEDFRDRFVGKTSAEIYTWAYEQYWQKCNRKHVVYVPVFSRQSLPTAIADYAIYSRSFCYDLATRPDSVAEYNLISKIYSELEPFSILLGWHSPKDAESDYVKLASKYAHRIEGLESLPNMSLHSQIRTSPDFKFKQKHQYNSNPKVEDKVYITLIQSDGVGFGSWLKPGRGDIPYGWEVNMTFFEWAPGLLQFYYEEAAPNDCFIGSLGGPGYMYPKAVPSEKLPKVLQLASELTKQLDMHVFEIYDATEQDTRELPKEIVDTYYKEMPDMLGFFNGYISTYTFDCRDGRPFISHDYYIYPTTSVDEAIADLKELAHINPRRPYFLSMHVRESNKIASIKNIINKLGSEFEVVPPEEFMIMAGMKPTMTTRFEEPMKPDFSGKWELDKKKSRNIGFYQQPHILYNLEIKHNKSLLTIKTITKFRVVKKSSVSMTIGGDAVMMEDRTRHMGYMGAKSDSVLARVNWDLDGETLIFNSQLKLETSQGIFPAEVIIEFRLSESGLSLIITEKRTSRKHDQPMIFVFNKIK